MTDKLRMYIAAHTSIVATMRTLGSAVDSETGDSSRFPVRLRETAAPSELWYGLDGVFTHAGAATLNAQMLGNASVLAAVQTGNVLWWRCVVTSARTQVLDPTDPQWTHPALQAGLSGNRGGSWSFAQSLASAGLELVPDGQ